MKQPIITRDLERKAIYSDILYDPEWLYVSIKMEYSSIKDFSILVKDCEYDFVVDWGDGCIERNNSIHHYNRNGIYVVRIKGYINYIGDNFENVRLFGSLSAV